jgi:glycosyltransferase involved in cell wall biosynthesis
MTQSLMIAIHAELPLGGYAGGVEQFLLSLIGALGRLDDGPERYVVVAMPSNEKRLAEAMGANQRLVVRRQQQWKQVLAEHLGNLADKLSPWYSRLQYLLHGNAAFQPVESDSFWKSLPCDLIHFPFQHFELTGIPSIYNPHDLQHRHYPEFFTSAEVARRDVLHAVACRSSAAVAAESFAAREDIIQQYRTPEEKVVAIPRGAPTIFYRNPVPEDLEAIRHGYALPPHFMLYPAQYWPHKNHVRLLKSLANLRDKHGIIANLVCTGRRSHDWPRVREQTRALRLDGQVQFLGFVEPGHLRALYRLADFLIFPSLFEGGGFPILEAFQEGTPVACSTATSLPEYGGDAVLLFDPDSTEDMAEAVRRMWSDADLRQSLRTRGSARAQLFTWDQTARTYRALYRKIAGRKLGTEDAALLGRAQHAYDPKALR